MLEKPRIPLMFVSLTSLQRERFRAIPWHTRKKLIAAGLLDESALAALPAFERVLAETEVAKAAMNSPFLFNRRELAGLRRVAAGEPFWALEAVRQRNMERAMR
jgi:hypothetical protein